MVFKDITDTFESIIELKFDSNFQSSTSLDKYKKIRDLYSSFFKSEIHSVNELLLNGEDQKLKDKSLFLTKSLQKIKSHLTENYFIRFLEDSQLSKAEAKVISKIINNDKLNNSILSIMSKMLNERSLNVLRDYRQSAQARKDIKNTISKKDLDSVDILKPFVKLLAEKTTPSIRMELWQKIELYFKSGWGFEDLTTNKTNDITANKLKNLLIEANNNNEELSSTSDTGKLILELLEQRITSLGVPIKITNEKNLISGKNVPTAHIVDNENMKFKFKFNNLAGSSFIDWAMPDVNEPKKLHVSVATSDETCQIEGSQLFRYGYAVNELVKKNPELFSSCVLNFYSTCTFYDELDDFTTEIGKEFLERFNVTLEQREFLNLLPFLGMANNISSNYKTGIFSPEQLVDYNFCLIGSKSLIEDNNKYKIVRIFEDCIKTTLSVFNQDPSDDIFQDKKGLNILNHLFNLISTSKNEFYEDSSLMTYLCSDEVKESLHKIGMKIPEAQMNTREVNKGNFINLIESLSTPEIILSNKKIQEANYKQSEIHYAKLGELSGLIQQVEMMRDGINDVVYKLPANWEEMTLIERKKICTSRFIDIFRLLEAQGSCQYQVFESGRSVSNYNYRNYPLGSASYRNHLISEREYEKNAKEFMDTWKSCSSSNNWGPFQFIDKTSKLINNLMYNIAKNVSGHDLQNLKIPSLYTIEQASRTGGYNRSEVETKIKNLNLLLPLTSSYSLNKILEKNNELNQEIQKTLSLLQEKFSANDIKKVCEKLDINNENYLPAEIKKKNILN